MAGRGKAHMLRPLGEDASSPRRGIPPVARQVATAVTAAGLVLLARPNFIFSNEVTVTDTGTQERSEQSFALGLGSAPFSVIIALLGLAIVVVAWLLARTLRNRGQRTSVVAARTRRDASVLLGLGALQVVATVASFLSARSDSDSPIEEYGIAIVLMPIAAIIVAGGAAWLLRIVAPVAEDDDAEEPEVVPHPDVLMNIEDLHVRFRTARGTVFAVTDVSLDVRRGETLGLVGESGCGKSTTGRAIMQLPPPTQGRVAYEGRDLTLLGEEELRQTRTKVQMIFQDPISSLNPRRKVEDIVAEGLKIWQPTGWTTLAIAALVFTVVGGLVTLSMFLGGGIGTIGFLGVMALLVGIALGLMHFAGFGQAEDPGMAGRVDEILDAVGLDPTTARGRRPHQFSGGQCQRISIARAVVTEPDLIICDEPVSALDVSVQAQILNLLEDLKARYGLTLVFIAHDLAVVKNVSDRVAVMYLGRLCEVGTPDVIYANPAHPYTQLLLEAIPEPDPDHRAEQQAPLQGELPSPLAPPSGCHFRTRCPRAEQDCVDLVPEMAPTGDGRFVACHHPLVETVVDVGTATHRA